MQKYPAQSRFDGLLLLTVLSVVFGRERRQMVTRQKSHSIGHSEPLGERPQPQFVNVLAFVDADPRTTRIAAMTIAEAKAAA